jgi:hypothetical protein
MNIIEAVTTASTRQIGIMNLERNEWIIISGGALRWKNNRQPASLSPKDIMSQKWITEDDLITVSKLQIDEALSFLQPTKNEQGELDIVGYEHFIDSIMRASHTNKSRVPEPGE